PALHRGRPPPRAYRRPGRHAPHRRGPQALAARHIAREGLPRDLRGRRCHALRSAHVHAGRAPAHLLRGRLAHPPAGPHRPLTRGRPRYAAAVALSAFSKRRRTSSISASVMMRGGQRAMVSPRLRTIRPWAWARVWNVPPTVPGVSNGAREALSFTSSTP